MGNTPANIISPTPGSVVQTSLVTFTRDIGVGVTAYSLDVGTSLGSSNLLSLGSWPTTTAQANVPTNGSTIYVRIGSLINSAWVYNSYTYTAVTLAGSCPGQASIWPNMPTPSIQANADPNPYEIGVKFISDYNGWICGIRFFKGAGNTGVHVANLWTAAGAHLATATFNINAETAVGWQQVFFATPVFIFGGQTYIASYSAPYGHYALDTGYFANSGAAAAPLFAPSGPASGGNAVSALSPGVFPTYSNPASNNLWVDVLFTTSQPICPCSIWPGLPTPTITGAADGNGYEIGVKFRADYSATVTGIKFYKDVLNTGTHVAHLWSPSGQLLASATFTNETASGWQTVTFQGVPISAGVTYIASYSAPNGHYAIDTGYFASVGTASPPLFAPPGPASGGNAVAGLAPGAFPTFVNPSYNNLWVDVIFN